MVIKCPSASEVLNCSTVFDCKTSMQQFKIYEDGTTTLATPPYDCNRQYQMVLPWIGCDGVRPASGDVKLSDSSSTITFVARDDTGSIPMNVYDWNPNQAGTFTYAWGNSADPNLCTITVEVECEVSLHTPLTDRFEGHGGEVVNYNLDQVYPVTNLNESGAGSLQNAPSNSYLVFPNLSGTMSWANAHKFTGTNDIWVMGQTSPAGIQIRGGQSTNNPEGIVDLDSVRNHIWQQLRVRSDNPGNPNNCCHKAFGVLDSERIVVDHMSLAWGDDSTMDFYQSDSGSIINNFIYEGLSTNNISARNLLVARGADVTIAKNLFANYELRGPQVQDITDFDVYNNLSYNGERGLMVQAKNGTACRGNVECNLQILGALGQNQYWQNFGAENDSGNLRIYTNDNKILNNSQGNCATAPNPFWYDNNQAPPGSPAPAPGNIFVGTPFSCPRNEKLDVCDVRDYVLANGGANHNRDSYDDEIANEVLNNGGGLKTSAGPWPNMSGGNTKNPWDPSKPDYLSDAIKIECDLNPSSHQDTTQTNTIGGPYNDFVNVMNYCFGVFD